MKFTRWIPALMMTLTLAACGKKEDAPKATPSAAAPTKAAAPAAAPAPAPAAAANAYAIAAPPAIGLPECDALAAQVTTYNACTKLSDESRVVQKTTIEQLPEVFKMWTAPADPSQKDMAKTAVIAQCKDAAERLAADLKAVGC